eukprot:1464881-Prymnesium_polylepis.1
MVTSLTCVATPSISSPRQTAACVPGAAAQPLLLPGRLIHGSPAPSASKPLFKKQQFSGTESRSGLARPVTGTTSCESWAACRSSSEYTYPPTSTSASILQSVSVRRGTH